MFVRCSLRCQHCDHVVASIYTAKDFIPRRLLHSIATMGGATTDQAGRWYCGLACRANFRMTHSVATTKTPTS